MLSIASVASGAGAADYYARDGYYTDGQLTEHSQWLGRGAEALGLKGQVERDAFEACWRASCRTVAALLMDRGANIDRGST